MRYFVSNEIMIDERKMRKSKMSMELISSPHVIEFIWMRLVLFLWYNVHGLSFRYIASTCHSAIICASHCMEQVWYNSWNSMIVFRAIKRDLYPRQREIIIIVIVIAIVVVITVVIIIIIIIIIIS